MVEKTRIIDIYEKEGTFTSVFRKFKGFTGYGEENKEEYNTADLSILRHLLSNEKARMLHVIKTQKPGSIYELAKKLDRKFKPVVDDLKLLERFGFIELTEEKINNRTRHKPEVVVDTVTIHLKV